MIFVDLDNTLYNQEQILRYVFRRIGRFIEAEFGIPWVEVFSYLMDAAKSKTLRYPIFNDLVNLLHLDISPRRLAEMYRLYTVEYLERRRITLYRSALRLLETADVVIYTEGCREVQELKIANIERGYGLKLRFIVVEDKLRRENSGIFERTRPEAYIGDNPYTDFLVPNRLGIPTLRVLTGLYRGILNEAVEPAYRPSITLRSLRGFSPLLLRRLKAG